MKRDYKALLVDVDGTLVCPERKTVNERTAAALTALQARGILVAVATGRTPRAVRPEILGGFRPDYYICMNGTYVTDRNARTIYHHPMSQRQLDDICRLAVREDCPVGFAFSDGYYCYYKDEVYRPFYEKTNGDMTTLIDGTDRTRHLAGLPYAAFGIIAPEHLAAFTDPGLGLHITPFSKNVYDICQAGYTKAGGAEAVLAQTCLRWANLAVVGDGTNDMELLRAAGLGIAMGNAAPEVKAAADVVTDSVLEDGVLRAIERYF